MILQSQVNDYKLQVISDQKKRVDAYAYYSINTWSIHIVSFLQVL